MSSIKFSRNRTRANNLVVALFSERRATITIRSDAAGPTDVVLDVTDLFP